MLLYLLDIVEVLRRKKANDGIYFVKIQIWFLFFKRNNLIHSYRIHSDKAAMLIFLLVLG